MKMLFATVAIILLLLTPIVTRAQNAAGNEPLEARVDSLFSRYARSDAPGCAVAVVKA